MRRRPSRLLPLFLLVLVPRCGEDEAVEPHTGALVLTSDFVSGAYSSVDLETRQVSVNVGTVHSDAVCRFHEGLVYVVNRLGADNIQVLDPAAGFATLRQFSTGNGSNPQDICFAGEGKAYVPLYEEAQLLVVDPRTGEELGRVDLSSLADADGLPEMSSCVVVEGRAYVTLQNLDRPGGFVPSGASRMALIDTEDDTLVRGEALVGQNPVGKLFHDEQRRRLLMAAAGSFFDSEDGGLEVFELREGESGGFLVSESELGGNLGGFAFFRSNKAFALVISESFATSVASFDPLSGEVLDAILETEGFDLSAIAVNDRSELYVADASFAAPGIRILDAATDEPLLQTPLDVGLPPRDICFTR